MECVRHRHGLREDALLARLRQQPGDTLMPSGHGDVLGGVDGGNIHIGVRLAKGAHARLVGQHAGHRAVGGRTLHDGTAQRHHAYRLFQADDSRFAGGGILADAVADDGHRPHADRLPDPRQRVLDGEDQRLGDALVLQRMRTRSVRALSQRCADQGREQPVAAVERLLEDRVVLVQAPPYPGIAGALAGVQEHRTLGFGLRTRRGRRPDLVVGCETQQLAPQPFHVGRRASVAHRVRRTQAIDCLAQRRERRWHPAAGARRRRARSARGPRATWPQG